ncbi:uncharacterized protein [Garra rufa]|uniref:uncharacterized protein n=1 Tax=Garra rufa TaxID=137080 RepID=UPI003CCE6450
MFFVSWTFMQPLRTQNSPKDISSSTKITSLITKIGLKADTVPVELTSTSCTCTAGKALCNHLVAMFFQTAHFSMMQMQTVPPTMASTSMLQTWHRPRTQGIAAETTDQLVVKKPRLSSRSECKSTLYRAYTGPLPDPAVLAVGEAVKGLTPQPLISCVLNDLSELSLVDSRFGPVPRGSVLSYQCLPLKTKNKVKHTDSPLFPKLPIDGALFPRSLHFVPNFQQFLHLESLSVSQELSAVIEEQTQPQSKCPLWKEMRKPRVTASRFHETSHVRGETSGQALARRILKGTKQTKAMKTGIDKEPEVLDRYSELFNVNISPCGFVIHPDAPYLGASPDAKVYDPNADPYFGLAEVKCPDVRTVAEAKHIKIVNGRATLKKSHKYYYQIQGQLAVTGLSWCDLITDTEEDITVERVWRDSAMITQMRENLDLYYFCTYMDEYLKGGL